MPVNPRRLYRSRDRQLAGVAGGMAEYLDLDPTIMRILWIVIGIASGGLAIIAYVLLALVIPQAPTGDPAAASTGWASQSGGPGAWTTAPGAWTTAPGAATTGWSQERTWGQSPASAPQGTAWTPPAAPTGWTAPAPSAPAPGAATRGIGAAAIIGVVLIVVGAIALADIALPGWAAGALLGPAVILALGAALLVASVRRPADGPATSETAPDAGSTSGSEPDQATPWDDTDTQTVGADEEAGDPSTGQSGANTA
jgi:phage shock protein C